ncbi:MAG: amylo-alpha-1,6-glucosidase [Phycisphaerales bacterium]
MPPGVPNSVFRKEQIPARGGDEWLLTNGLGGFAFGCASGVPGRRYHGWLVAAMSPPVGRVVALAACAEWLVVRAGGGEGAEAELRRFDLSTFRFVGEEGAQGAGVASPGGAERLERFERTQTSCRWSYAVPEVGARVTRELFLFRHANAASVRYGVEWGKDGPGIGEAWLEVRPFTPMRDFHGLVSREDEGAYSVSDDGGGDRGVRVASRVGAVTVALDGGGGGRFSHGRQWWRNFLFTRDRERGQPCVEHWFSPGAFVVPLRCQGQRPGAQLVEVRAAMEGSASLPADTAEAQRAEAGRLESLADAVARRAGGERPFTTADRAIAGVLAASADQFVVRRVSQGSPTLSSVIAGYPWFSDWGRDSMISLPGLMLACGRLEEARDTLVAFAGLRRRGLIPNCFDNGSGQAQYNTVDASLWFVHACCEYLRAGGDASVFARSLRPACLEIIDAYRAGTDFGIRMDERDGLISAGTAQTQLTWMDAERDGVVFTPRAGKAVEVNALWYNALRSLALVLEHDAPRTARELSQVADVVARGYEKAFWNPQLECLFDSAPVTLGSGQGAGGTVMAADADAVRPNQIFAVSLPCSPLTRVHQQAVILSVHKELATPLGLRTLARSHPMYQARYEGALAQRDAAYHQGTVWPYLMGAYIEAILRVEKFSAPAKTRCRELLTPLLAELLGVDTGARTPLPVRSLCEVYDGDEVAGLGRRRAEGCPMQAWSVAELLRAWVLTQ